MSELRKEVEQALDEGEIYDTYGARWGKERIDALRAALAQPEPEPEPVAWWDGKESVVFTHDEIYAPNWTDYWTRPLYTHQPQRQPLTEEEIAALSEQHIFASRLTKFVRAIEKAHGIGGQP